MFHFLFVSRNQDDGQRRFGHVAFWRQSPPTSSEREGSSLEKWASTTSILMTRNLAERREFSELGSSADGQLLHSEWLRHHENDDHEHDGRRGDAKEVAAPSGHGVRR